ncbi:YiiX family permuted papain-like enzyme [Uliginosibacterium gangwonense]|uniref:YiiX family permuted papain-like enzyme n=1 Tax=Uliginosibacterium gangwonense TaxID=392736 RepID=UPI00035F0B9C|nr:YiiX family permuted papain-like enzyme [Uliginosibacterium gangwonense]
MRPLIRRILIASLLASQAACAKTPPAVQEGDVIFQTSRSAQSLAIQLATGSRYSHMGIVLFRAGKPYVFEASATARYTPLQAWIDRGEGQHYVLKRLRTATTSLTPAAIKKLYAAARTFEGRPYDLTFEWSDQRVYCSELAWKMYDRALDLKIGELQHLRDFNLSAPAVQQKLLERYHGRIPLDEQVISPVAMYDSPLLTTVAQQ